MPLLKVVAAIGMLALALTGFLGLTMQIVAIVIVVLAFAVAGLLGLVFWSFNEGHLVVDLSEGT